MIYEHGEPGSTGVIEQSYITSYEEACGVAQRVHEAVRQLNQWAHAMGTDWRDAVDDVQGRVAVLRTRIILGDKE